MKPENKEFLEKNYHHWVTLRDAFYLRSLDGNTRENMQRIMGEEFQPGYTNDLWCSECCIDMVRSLYQRYDQWKKDNPDAAPIIIQADFPKHENKANGDTRKHNHKRAKI